MVDVILSSMEEVEIAFLTPDSRVVFHKITNSTGRVADKARYQYKRAPCSDSHTSSGCITIIRTCIEDNSY